MDANDLKGRRIGVVGRATREELRPIKELAREACLVQDACNLVAVVKGMDRALSHLRLHLTGGSDELAEHPITRAWADKIASLCGIQFNLDNAVGRAHAECDKLSHS